MKDIQSKIKSIRLIQNLKQEDVAQKLGMSKANYSRIEKGDVTLTPEKLEILQDIFGMTSDEIRAHETAQERLGWTNSSVLEETIKQQAAHIERMQTNTEYFLEALVKHFQKSSVAPTLEKDTPMDAVAAVFNIEGLAHILNKENTPGSPLLKAYSDYKKAQTALIAELFIDAVNNDLKKENDWEQIIRHPMRAPNTSYYKPTNPQINFNLKLNQKDVASQTRKRIVTLEQAGLSDNDYQLLLQERLIPRPLEINKYKQLNIVECIWITIAKELNACNYSTEVMQRFMHCLFADIIDETDQYLAVEEVTTDTFAITAYSNTVSTFLELLVAAVLNQQEDLVLQFTRDGKIGFLAQVPSSDCYSLQDQAVLSFSVYSILKSLVGAANIPDANSQSALISQEEKQVLELARAKGWEKIEVKQVAYKDHAEWLLATSKYIVLSNQEFNTFSRTVPRDNRLNNVEYGQKAVKFEYIERSRLKV